MFALMKNLKFQKEEKLKSKKLIGNLYKQGTAIKVYPLRLVYLNIKEKPLTKFKIGVSVPKRNFKKATDRNKIKRLLREIYRLNKNKIFLGEEKSYIFMISYLAKEELPYRNIEKKMIRLLEKFIETIDNDKQ